MKTRWFVALGLICCAASSCRLESSVRSHTQIVVDIDAEPLVRGRSDQVRLVVAGSPDRASIERAEPSLEEVLRPGQPGEPNWPLRLALAPRGDDIDRVFALTATALDVRGHLVAQVRVVSGYVANEIHHVRLWLSADCVGIGCSDQETCTAGACTQAWRDPSTWPLYWPTRDAGARDAQVFDAQPSDAQPDSAVADAALDAAGDAALDATSQVPVEAGVPIDPCQQYHGGCDELVSCQNLDGVAVCGACPAGYVGDGKGGLGCEDVDECLLDNGGCDVHRVCVNALGSVACGACAEGYTPTGTTGCTDVEECVVDNGGCDPLRVCMNTAGSRTCGNCPLGYVNSGPSGCSDVDECLTSNGGCDPLRACINTIGARTCGNCPSPGYVNSGATACSDVDECALNNGGCDPLRACINTIGARTCGNCPSPGYTDNGATGCDDVDECLTNNGGCDPLRACLNTIGGRNCGDCPAGYVNNEATGCSDVDECLTNNAGCDPLRACVNTPGGSSCGNCPPGYVNDGPTGCSDVDECLTNNGDCSAPRVCMNTLGGRTCGPCGVGYTDSGATACADIDECAVGHGGCDASRACVNTVGSFACGACPVGYRQDGATGCAACSCFEASDGSTATCATHADSLPAAVAEPSAPLSVIPAATLIGFRITLPASSNLLSFGVYNMGPDVAGLRIGLYSDDAGMPGLRVAHTASLPNAPPGPSSAAAQYDAGAACLEAGSYWMIAFADSDMTLGPSAGASTGSVSLTGYTDLPTTWPAGGTATNTGALSMWVSAQYP